ncbi:hypothetical protein [Streptomyces griseiscabiei]|uniref:Integrase n=1 Tax=Streptomyces griseiscabiei TaxID=2993540 RepID=A0ABU4LDE7_9ACTN|nr:hypothetical protein [Streptomyces griseiscabiei]MBZ3906716.1 hypothetical protein [Streptomyces griseiscabiei]MDX2913781.1 hypothetical protein [Streptomyces griseiscabiei]
MAALLQDGRPVKTSHATWAAIMRIQSPKGRKALKEYREELWVQWQKATAPPLTVAQTRMLRRVKTDLTRSVMTNADVRT